MKKFVFFCVLCMLVAAIGQAQTNGNVKIGQSYVTKVKVMVNPYDAQAKKPVSGKYFFLNDGVKFFITEILDNGYVITLWDFKDIPAKRKFYDSLLNQATAVKSISPQIDKEEKYYRYLKTDVSAADKASLDGLTGYDLLAYVDSWANEIEFFIPLKDFNQKCESIYPKSNNFTWGFLTLPIKARFKNSDANFTFEEKVNFGLSFGWKWQTVSTIPISHNLLAGTSISSVKFDETTTAAALSFSLGYMYQYDKFQVGAFIGKDYISGAQSKTWAFQGKPWLGIAIGVSLFGESKTAAASDQSQNK